MHRKTRFVCVSDTHGYTPSEAGFRLPAGDVLIHAGDLTNQGRKSELRKTVDWIANADFEIKIVIAGKYSTFGATAGLKYILLIYNVPGNHDTTLDPEFYAANGLSFHNQRVEDPEKCIDIVARNSSSILYLRHHSAVVRLTRKNGPRTVFKVFGSPFSQFKGSWAFGYKDTEAVDLWEKIPPDADIVVTHTPPSSFCDSGHDRPSAGCKALSQALSKVRPMLVVCGHIHEGRGCVRVRWPAQGAADAQSATRCEVVREDLPPLGSKKQCLVDLTGKRRRQLENEGLVQMSLRAAGETMPHVQLDTTGQIAVDRQPQGNGEDSPLRAVRKETCVVNAAIVATSWPHTGGRKFNTPVVVDMLLPVWHDG